MRVKVFVISGLLIIFSIAQVWASNSGLDDQINKASLIKLASSKILEKNIEKVLGNTHFLDKTQLHSQLAGTSKSLEEINEAIDLAICDYVNNIKKGTIPTELVATLEKVMNMSKPSLRRAILEPDEFN